MREWWMIQIKFVFDTISLKQISPLTQSVVFWDSRMLASQDKMIYSTKKKHTRSMLCELLYVLSLSLTQNECTKYFLSRRVIPRKVSFHDWETMNLYIMNRHTVQRKTVVHILTDSKNKIIKIIIWTRGPSPHMSKPYPMFGPWAYKFIYYLLPFLCGTQDFHHF